MVLESGVKSFWDVAELEDQVFTVPNLDIVFDEFTCLNVTSVSFGKVVEIDKQNYMCIIFHDMDGKPMGVRVITEGETLVINKTNDGFSMKIE